MKTASFALAELTDQDFAKIRQIIYEKSGISLHAGKGALVTARLQKRLWAGGFRSFRDYVRYVQADPSGEEMTQLVNAIATNHTAFFREPQHFVFLRDVVLPPLVARQGPVLGWSAACSTGEEPYTIAITVLDRFGSDSRRRVRLLATDLSTKALAIARPGIYKTRRTDDVPRDTLLRYFERSATAPQPAVRVSPQVRELVEFKQLNLLEPPPSLPTFDFIFCRNVMIYFDRQTQQRVVATLESRLAPGGYLFISHSESLNSISHGLTWIAPAVYRSAQR